MSTTASARIFLIRHGDTDWITGGKHGSRTDVPLTKQGESETEWTRDRIFGAEELIDPHKISKIYCSPRIAALRTVQLLRMGVHNHQHFYDRESESECSTPPEIKSGGSDPYIQITKALQEWNYGDYEGMTWHDIQAMRKKQGEAEPEWNIWRDGCPGGESPAQVSERVDELIAEIKAVIEKSSPSWPSGQVSRGAVQAQDIVCVGHGHVLAAFLLRWVGLPLEPNAVRLVLEPSGVAVLGFEDDNINLPAIIFGRRPGRPRPT